MRWRPRFSLRTLCVFLLLVTSGMGLWWHWEAWYRASSFQLLDSGSVSGRYSRRLSADGKTFRSGDERGLRIWSARTGERLSYLKGQIIECSSMDSSKIVTWGLDGTVHLRGAADGEPLATLGPKLKPPVSAQFSYDGKLVAAWSRTDAPRIFEARSGRSVSVLGGHEGKVWELDFSPDGTRAVTASEDGTTRLWETRSGKCVRERRIGHPVYMAFFSPDGAVIVNRYVERHGKESIWLLWDSATGEQIVRLDAGWLGRFSPDGTKFLMVDHPLEGVEKATTAVWETRTARRIRVIRCHPDLTRGPLFSADGARFLSANTVCARLWDVDTGECLGRLDFDGGNPGNIGNAFFSEDGRRAVVWRTQSRVSICDGYDLRPLWAAPGSAFGLSDDGRTLAVKYWDGNENVHIYRRRRPEWWWGVFWLWEFWLTVAFAGVFLWSVVRDRRALGRQEAAE